MTRKGFWISILAVLLAFAGGFLLANSLNRREMDDLRAEAGRLRNAAPAPASEQNLSENEIRQKIEQADRNPDNIDYQKNLALALYRYAEMKQEARWLSDVARLLTRVHEKEPKDLTAATALGNVYFSLSQNGGDPEDLEKSRLYYAKALEIKPSDADVRTDLGATFLFARPPEHEKAVAEFEKSLRIDPRNERALLFAVQASIGAAKWKEAETHFENLKQVNPENKSLSELASEIERGKNAQK